MKRNKAWLIPFLFMVSIATQQIYAEFLVETRVYTVTVLESAQLESPFTLEIELFACDSKDIEIVITNLSSNPLPIEISASAEPTEGIEVIEPGQVVVPPDEQPHIFLVTMNAECSADPQPYEVTVHTKRG